MTDQDIFNEANERYTEGNCDTNGSEVAFMKSNFIATAKLIRDRMQAENRLPESLLSENEIDRGIQEQLLKEIFGSFPSCEKDVLVNTLLTSTKECVHAVKQAEKLRDGTILRYAVEFGYKQCEKGNNLETALILFNLINR